MKKLLLLVLPIALVFPACNKYEDGPALSLLTKKERLCNTWIIHSAYKNDVDQTSDFNAAFAGYTLTIKKDETYTLSYRPFNVSEYSESGTWNFNDKKTTVTFNKSGSSDATTWTILRLKQKELWAEYTDSGDVYEVHLVEK